MKWLGRRTIQIKDFVEALNKGKSGLWIGPDVVAMPRRDYDRLVEAAHPVKGRALTCWMDESHELSEDVWRLLRKRIKTRRREEGL